jgi:hypothetical protein
MPVGDLNAAVEFIGRRQLKRIEAGECTNEEKAAVVP